MYNILMYKKNICFKIMYIMFVFASCDILRESAFEVAAWSPGSGVQAADTTVSLSFSHNADKASVEKAFSLTADGENVRGAFDWDGKTVIFTPAAPLETGRDYDIALSVSAKDTDGLSLERKFEAGWTTRPDTERPSVLGVSPDGQTPLFDRETRVKIRFSRPVTVLSCKNSISITPSIQGYWALEDGDCTAVFCPVELWKDGTVYKVTVSKDMESAGGRLLGNDHAFSFNVGNDSTKPELTGVFAVDAQGAAVFPLTRAMPDSPLSTGAPLPTGTPSAATVAENGQWENTYSLRFEFSENIDMARFKNHITIEPAERFAIDGNAVFADTAMLRFTARPAYLSRFTITISDAICDASGNQNNSVYIYRIYVNGIHSKPPALAAVRFPLSPHTSFAASQNLPNTYPAAGFQNAVMSYPYSFNLSGAENYYKYGVDTDTWLELYFDTADGAAIDLISIREKFRIEGTNNAIVFSPYSVIDSGFTWQNPAAEFSAYRRVEVRGVLNNVNRSGLVTFYIGSGLSDSLGNKNEDVQRIELYK